MSAYPLVRLDEVAEVRLGRQRAPKNHRGDHMRPYMRAANVGWSGLKLDDVKQMNFTDVELETYRLAPGDLILSEASGSPGEVGKPALWSEEIEDCAFQNTLLRVRPREHEPAFLLHYFRFVALSGHFVRESRGVGINHLGRARLAGWMTPLPTLGEQRRIVEILEDHLSRLDTARSNLLRACGRLASLHEAALSALMPEDGPTEPLINLLGDPLANGRSVPTRDDGFPVLRLTALKDAGVDFSERKLGAWSRAEASRFLVHQGDFLIARGNGSLRLVGRGSLVRTKPDEVAFPDTVIRARPKTSSLLPEFLDVAWNSRRTRAQIERVARTSAGIYKVNQSQLERIKLPLLPVAEQRRVIADMQIVDDNRRRLRTAIAHAEQRQQVLRRAVMAAAFEGKLTGRHTDTEVIEEAASLEGTPR